MESSQHLPSPEKNYSPFKKREYSADSRNQYQNQLIDVKNLILNSQYNQQLNSNMLSNSVQQAYHPNLLTIGASKIQYQQNSQSINNQTEKNFNHSLSLNDSKNLAKSYLVESPEQQKKQSFQQQQNLYGVNPQISNSYQIPQNQQQNTIKEMRFPQNSYKTIHNQHNRIFDFNGYSQNLNGLGVNEDRNKVLKKILAHFNFKVQQLERKQFMNIFGLEIKQIPPQDLIKTHKLNQSQVSYNAQNKRRQQRIINSNDQQNNNSDLRLDESLSNSRQAVYESNKLNQSYQEGNNINRKYVNIQNSEQQNNLNNQSENGFNTLKQGYASRSKSQDQQLQLDEIKYSNFQHSTPIDDSNRMSVLNDEINENDNDDDCSNFIKCSQNNSEQEQKKSSSSNESDSKDQNRYKYNVNNVSQLDRVYTPTGVIQNRRRISSSQYGGARQSNVMMMVRKLPKSNNGNQNFKFSLNDNNQQREEIFYKKFNTYRDFIFKINFANHIFINIPFENPVYKIAIGRGNNSKLIKNCIKNRWWWQIVDFDHHNEANFLWTQCKVQQFFDRQDNLESPHTEEEINSSDVISEEFLSSRAMIVFKELIQQGIDSQPRKTSGEMNNTTRQFTSLQSSPEKRQGMRATQGGNNQNQGVINGNSAVFKGGINDNKATGTSINKQNNNFPQYSDHNQKLFSNQDYQVYSKYMNSQQGQRDYISQNWEDLSFRLKFLKRNNIEKPYKMIESSQKSITHNHLQFNFHLGNKKALFYNMRQYYQLLKDDVFNYLPLTFHLTKGTEDKEFRNFLKKFKEIENQNNESDESKKGQKKQKNVWIVKPGEITNRGNGIQVCDNLTDIKKILTSKEKHSNGKEKTYIVQKYIDRPFLYNRRKFDIRAYMMISCINGVLRAYWYQEGYIRTSGREFDLSDVSDVFIHLTNDAIQKDCEEYNKYEPGNKLSYFEFQRYLEIWYPDQKYNLFSQIIPKMKAIATDSVRATFLKLDPQRKQNNFEVYGLDFMIDDRFKPYLIEINTNPAIETTCPICLRVIPGMIENAFRIGLDPLFPPPANWPGQKKHLAPDSLTEHNKFEIIFDEQFDGIEIKRLYKNQENCCKITSLEGVNDLDEDEEIDDEKSNKDKNEEKDFDFD